MTVSTIYARVEYEGDASTVSFPVPWMFLESDDLRLTKINDTTDAETAVTSFTTTGEGEEAGGTVILPAPIPGFSLRIERLTDRTQEMDLQPQGRFPARDLERSVDKLTLIVQELEERIGRIASGGPGTGVETIVTDDPDRVQIEKIGTEVTINVTQTYDDIPGPDLELLPDGDLVLKQATGVGSKLIRVETDFSWSGWAGGTTLGGRGIAAGYAWFGDPGSQVHLPVWCANDAYATLYWTRDFWATTVEDISLAGIIGPGVLDVKPPCMTYVKIGGVWCWVLTSDSTGAWWYAQDIAANYNPDGTLEVAAWVAGTPATRVMADIATSTLEGVSCMVGNHSRIIRTTDWATWADVHNTGGPVVGGIATDNDGTWIAVERDTGKVIRSVDGGLTWTNPTIWERVGEGGAYSSTGTLIPAGSVTHGNGTWLVTGASSYAYSTDGVYWTIENSALGSFYGVGFDGIRYFATNPNNGADPAIIYQLLVSSIPFHRQVVAERGLVVGGDAYFKDLPWARGIGTDQNGKAYDMEIPPLDRPGKETVASGYVKLATLRVVDVGGTSSFAAEITTCGRSSGASDTQRARLFVRVKQVSAMSSPLDAPLVEILSEGLTSFGVGYAVEQDDAVEKRISVYIFPNSSTHLYKYSVTAQFGSGASSIPEFFEDPTPLASSPAGYVEATHAPIKAGAIQKYAKETTEHVGGCIYSQWGTVPQSGVKVNASLASASSIGSRSIGAARLNYKGACLDVQASGFLTTDASPGTGAMRVTVGATTFRDITFSLPTSVTDVPWTLRGRIMVREPGSSSEIHGVMVFEYTDASGVVQRPKPTGAEHVTGINLDVANDIGLDWTASDAGTSLVVTDIEMQMIR